MLKGLVHITKQCESIEECEAFLEKIKAKLKGENGIHINGQVTVKFTPSHPEGTPEEAPAP